MSDGISQEEIDALLNGGASEDTAEVLTDKEIDVLGEVANISMGTASTTLSSLLNEKVNITTPKVVQKKSIASMIEGNKIILVNIKYKQGLDGSFMFILNESDAKVIAGIMMGGADLSAEPLNDIHLSALAETMNQMVGTSCTSMSQVFDNVVDICPPSVEMVDFSENTVVDGIDLSAADYVVVEFDITVGEKLSSKMMQILSYDVSKQLINKLLGATAPAAEEPAIAEQTVNVQASTAPAFENTGSFASTNADMAMAAPMMGAGQMNMNMNMAASNGNAMSSNVQNVEFSSLVAEKIELEREKISLIQDVPLEVVVELGRTNKSIKEILEFSPGVVIELNKMAGDPIDILINNKFIAKGEVVVIDENFGIRITEIVDINKRI